MNDTIVKYLLDNPTLAYWLSEPDTTIVCKVVCALANTTGGCVLLGVGDDSTVVGIDEAKASNLPKDILNMVSPQPPFTTSIHTYEGKCVMLINVWEGNHKPYCTSNAFYVKVGDSIKKANAGSIAELTQSQSKIDNSWERQYVENVVETDLSNGTIERFRIALVGGHRLSAGSTTEDVISRLGLYSYEQLTNAGVLLLCESPSKFLPQTRIRVSRFSGKGVGSDLISVNLYDHNLVTMVDEIADYISSLYQPRIFIQDIARTEIYPLPKNALREGLLNAIVHRRYDRYDTFVAINIFNDRLEIINSGQLAPQLTVESLSQPHQSFLVNPDIANAFYMLGYIEMAGSGTLRILKECKANNCKTPKWEILDGFVKLTFFAELSTPGVSQRSELDLSDISTDANVRRQLAVIIRYMRSHSYVKLGELAELTGKSYPSVKRYMKTLSDAGIIEYQGNLRSGGWVLTIK